MRGHAKWRAIYTLFKQQFSDCWEKKSDCFEAIKTLTVHYGLSMNCSCEKSVSIHSEINLISSNGFHLHYSSSTIKVVFQRSIRFTHNYAMFGNGSFASKHGEKNLKQIFDRSKKIMREPNSISRLSCRVRKE